VFPILATPLPAEKRAFLSQIETPIIFFFSTACGEFFPVTELRDAPRSHPRASPR
jgi:hypothetical protein